MQLVLYFFCENTDSVYHNTALRKTAHSLRAETNESIGPIYRGYFLAMSTYILLVF